MKIIRIPPESRIMMEYAFDALTSHCEDADVFFCDFALCCNSTYVLLDDDNNFAFKGIIACRRIHADDVDESIVKYHPQKYHIIYKIEVLHYDSSVSIGDIFDLINTCLVDKNDAFIIMECHCRNVIYDIDLLKTIGFYTGYEDNDKVILVKAPKTQ